MNKSVFHMAIAATMISSSFAVMQTAFAIPPAAEKDARDIMQAVGKGADMAGHAISSTAEKVSDKARNANSPEAKRDVSDKASSSLDTLRDKTENGGRAIASALKGLGDDAHAEISKTEARTTDRPTRSPEDSNAFERTMNEFGRNLSQAFAGVENFFRNLGNQTRAQLAKTK